MLLISFIVYIDTPDYRGQINRILRSIKKVPYPKKQIEFLIYAKEAHALRVYKIPGPPLLRIFPDNIATSLINECHGDVIFVIDEWFRFPENFMIGRATRARFCVGKKYFEVSKSFRFSSDTLCLRTSSIMQAAIQNRKIHGRWGKLNRKEILRIIYKWGEISGWNKIRIIWRYIWGE